MQSKARLRPWLESIIGSEHVPGLVWLDAEKTKFKIPWKHRSKQDWTPESGQIFLEWAKNTGRYIEGVHEVNYPLWKTRLRCAFNKAKDMVEVKEESREQSAEPYRVYLLSDVKPCMGSDTNDDLFNSQYSQNDFNNDCKTSVKDEYPSGLESIQNLFQQSNTDSSLLPTTVTELESVDSSVTDEEFPSHRNSMELNEFEEGHLITHEQAEDAAGELSDQSNQFTAASWYLPQLGSDQLETLLVSCDTMNNDTAELSSSNQLMTLLYHHFPLPLLNTSPLRNLSDQSEQSSIGAIHCQHESYAAPQMQTYHQSCDQLEVGAFESCDQSALEALDQSLPQSCDQLEVGSYESCNQSTLETLEQSLPQFSCIQLQSQDTFDTSQHSADQSTEQLFRESLQLQSSEASPLSLFDDSSSPMCADQLDQLQPFDPQNNSFDPQYNSLDPQNNSFDHLIIESTEKQSCGESCMQVIPSHDVYCIQLQPCSAQNDQRDISSSNIEENYSTEHHERMEDGAQCEQTMSANRYFSCESAGPSSLNDQQNGVGTLSGLGAKSMTTQMSCDTQRAIELAFNYCGGEVQRRTLNKTGTLIYRETSIFEPKLMTGADDVSSKVNSQIPDMIYFPEWSVDVLHKSERVGKNVTFEENMKNAGLSLLRNGLTKGVSLWISETYDIFACRQCRSAVFVVSELETNGKSIKIPLQRPQSAMIPMRIFSYLDKFVPALRGYIEGRHSRPDPVTYILIGQTVENIDDIRDNVLIYVTATSTKVLNDLNDADLEVAQRLTLSPIIDDRNVDRPEADINTDLNDAKRRCF